MAMHIYSLKWLFACINFLKTNYSKNCKKEMLINEAVIFNVTLLYLRKFSPIYIFTSLIHLPMKCELGQTGKNIVHSNYTFPSQQIPKKSELFCPLDVTLKLVAAIGLDAP